MATFADKFSKYKRRFFLIFWPLFFLFVFIQTFQFSKALYSISKNQTSFYAITVHDDEANYQRVDTKPNTWIPLEQISKRVQQAIISSEDGKFYLHPGYDLEQLRDAVNDSFVLKKKMRGASTITQQLVKNLFLNRSKTFGRKAQELVMALMIEKYCDKKKILESYLNIIEYGKGLYGIDSAAHFYFYKNALAINAREAAFLAMLLPSPKKYSKSFKNRELTPFANRMIDSILHKMLQAGFIGVEEYNQQVASHFSWEKSPELNTEPLAGGAIDSEQEFGGENTNDD